MIQEEAFKDKGAVNINEIEYLVSNQEDHEFQEADIDGNSSNDDEFQVHP